MRLLASGLIVCLLAAGCADPSRQPAPASDTGAAETPGAPDPAEPNADPSAETGTETGAQAPDLAAPDDVDPVYVARVLAALDEVADKATADSRAAGDVTQRSVDLLSAVYQDPALTEQLTALYHAAERGFRDVEAGVSGTTLTEIIASANGCVLVRVSGVEGGPTEILALRLTSAPAEVAPLNPTPWQIFHRRLHRGTPTVPPLCVGDS